MNVIAKISCYFQGSHASWKVLEIPGVLFVKFPGPGKSWKWDWSWKVLEVLVESPGIFCQAMTWETNGGHNGVGADAKICACAVRTSLQYNTIQYKNL